MSILAQIRAGAQNRTNGDGAANPWKVTGGATTPNLNPNVGTFRAPTPAPAPTRTGSNPLPWASPSSVAKGVTEVVRNPMTQPYTVNADQFMQIASLLSGAADGQRAVADNIYNRAVTAANLRNQGYGNVEAAVRNTLNADLAGVNLDRMETQVGFNYIPKYMGFLNDQARIATGQYHTALEQLAGAEGETRGLIAIDRAETGRLMGESTKAEGRDMRRMLGEQAAAGAVTTFGTRDMGGQIRQEGQSQREGLREELNRSETRYVKAMNDIRTGRDKLNWDLKSSLFNIAEARTKLEERQDLLRIEAQRHNITASQLQARAQERLAQLGLERAISFGQLLEAQNSRDAAKAAAATQFVQGLVGAASAFGPTAQRNPRL